MADFTIEQQMIRDGGDRKLFTWVMDVGADLGLDENIPASAVDLQLTWPVPITALKFFALKAIGGALTVKTNSSTVPDKTFSLIDGKSFVWVDGWVAGGFAVPLSVAIASLFVTNPLAASVRLTGYAGWDATP